MNVSTSVKWEKFSHEKKVVERVLANLSPLAIVNGYLVVKYSGEEKNKELVLEAFNKYRPDILQLVQKDNKCTNIVIRENISEIKLEWLGKLISQFEPKGVEFSILK